MNLSAMHSAGSGEENLPPGSREKNTQKNRLSARKVPVKQSVAVYAVCSVSESVEKGFTWRSGCFRRIQSSS